MITKKDLIVAVLVAFCLTATLFFAIPSRSQTGTGSSSNYNPLADLNHDGVIDIYDAILFSQAYGSSGDPTLPVNVTNWPISYETVLIGVMNCSWTNGGGFGHPSASVETAGFSQAYLYISPDPSWQASQGNYNVTVSICSISWQFSPTSFAFAAETPNYATNNIEVTVINGQVAGWGTQLSNGNSGLDVKGPYLQPLLYCNTTFPSSGWVMMDVYAYLRND